MQPATLLRARFRRNSILYSPQRDWHKIRITKGMLVAVPNCQGRVSPVFDVAARMLLVRLKGRAELERKDIVMFEQEPASIVCGLRGLGVELLICGGISQWLQRALEKAGIEVLADVCGELEAVLTAYRTGQLNRPEFLMPGCGRPCRMGRAGSREYCRRRKRLHRVPPKKNVEPK